MTFSLYALLDDDAPRISIDSLGEDLRVFFRNEEDFSLEFEKLPFSQNMTLALRWSDWLVRMSYEEGDDVKEDAIEIKKRATPPAGLDVPQISRRIRVVFGNDDEQRYTNQVIFVIDFLKAIGGVSIFDPQQNDFLE